MFDTQDSNQSFVITLADPIRTKLNISSKVFSELLLNGLASLHYLALWASTQQACIGHGLCLEPRWHCPLCTPLPDISSGPITTWQFYDYLFGSKTQGDFLGSY